MATCKIVFNDETEIRLKVDNFDFHENYIVSQENNYVSSVVSIRELRYLTVIDDPEEQPNRNT